MNNLKNKNYVALRNDISKMEPYPWEHDEEETKNITPNNTCKNVISKNETTVTNT